MIVTRPKFSMRPFLAALMLALLAVPAAAARETTAATLQADTQACTAASDQNACVGAFNYLSGQLNAGRAGGNTATMQATLRTMAETGCTIGNGDMCLEVAIGHVTGGNGWIKDETRGGVLLEKACELGESGSCWARGTHYAAGTLGPKDPVKARSLYEKGCLTGSFRGCKAVAANKLTDDVNAAPAAPEGIEALKSRCAGYALDGPSCVAVGIAYQRGSDGAEKNETLAWQYWAKACREISYARACYYHGLAVLRISDPKDSQSSDNRAARTSLIKACELGEMEACEFLIPGADAGALNHGRAMAEAHYRLCLNKPSLANCERAANAYANGTLTVSAGNYTIKRSTPKATLAWLTACRAFNAHCVEAADLHLVQQTFALPSPNLAIGILETACAKGDAASCARQAEVIAETGGVQGSFIDPMASDDERFMLAKFDMDSGDLDRGRETLQWLANIGHTDAQLELAIAYEAGLKTKRGGERVMLFDPNEMTAQLYELVAEKGIPDAAMRIAVRKYYENDHEGSDSYENAIARALYLGAEGAKELDAAETAQTKARWEAISQEMKAMNRRNVAARRNMDMQTVQSAWDLYAENQKKAAEAGGGEVCGRVTGQGNSSYHTCMSRDHALKYYRGDF